MGTYLISTSLRIGAFELRLDLILLWRVCRQPLGPDHIKKIISCILPYGGRHMGTYLISTSLRRGAFGLRLDLILLWKVRR